MSDVSSPQDSPEFIDIPVPSESDNGWGVESSLAVEIEDVRFDVGYFGNDFRRC